MEFVLRSVPDFAPRWEAHLNYWQGKPSGLCLDMSEFSHYVGGLIQDDNVSGLPLIFDVVEDLVRNGDISVRTAATTCFLENLLNLVPDTLPPERFVHLLGPESREFCVGWDTFTGVHTRGLDQGHAN